MSHKNLKISRTQNVPLMEKKAAAIAPIPPWKSKPNAMPSSSKPKAADVAMPKESKASAPIPSWKPNAMPPSSKPKAADEAMPKVKCGAILPGGRRTCAEWAAGKPPCMALRCKTHCPDPPKCPSHKFPPRAQPKRSPNHNPGKAFAEMLKANGLRPPPTRTWEEWKERSNRKWLCSLTNSYRDFWDWLLVGSCRLLFEGEV